MRRATKAPKVATVQLDAGQYTRLRALAQRWNVSTSEALRRALDQAYVGRGAMCALEAGFTFLEHMSRKPEEKKP